MLGIGRAATVSAEEKRAAAPQHLGVPRRYLGHLAAERLGRLGDLNQRIETLLDPISLHLPPSRNSLIRLIQLCRIRIGGTGVRAWSSRMADGFRTARSSTCSVPS